MSDNQSENSGRWGYHGVRSREEVIADGLGPRIAFKAPLYPESVKKIPEGEHFMVIHEGSVSYPDPYESRSSASTISDTVFKPICFNTIAEVEDWVLRNKDERFRILKVEPMTFELKVSVTVKK